MKNLFDIIGEVMVEFDFNKYYAHEIKLIQPALEKLGYTNIRFSNGEYDSFGPLSRIVTALDKNGDTVKFYYN